MIDEVIIYEFLSDLDMFFDFPTSASQVRSIMDIVIEHSETYHYYAHCFIRQNLGNDPFMPRYIRELRYDVRHSMSASELRLGGFTLEFHMRWNHDSHNVQFESYMNDIIGPDRDL